VTANEDLIDWNVRWRISNGVVSCKTCQAQQCEIDRHSAFSHAGHCGHASHRTMPWDDLDSICKKLDTGC
jgi:hypothetical protein